MLTLVAPGTAPAVMGNTTEVAPAGTATDAGIEATVGLPLRSETFAPPLGAGFVRMTRFPSSVTPLLIDVLASFKEATAGAAGRTISDPETVWLP